MDFQKYFSNIYSNIHYLKNDFTGITLSISGILNVISCAVISAIIFFIFLILGRRIRLSFFKSFKFFLPILFIDIAAGYIFLGTGIAILGIFSLLSKNVLFVYLLVLITISVTDKLLIEYLKNGFYEVYYLLKSYSKIHPYIFLSVVLFILIAVFRLMPPEIGEDAVGYHTDLPERYLLEKTTMIRGNDPLFVIPYSQLSEMLYILPIAAGVKDSTRYIHFGFYFLIVLVLITLSAKGNYRLFSYAPLIFVSSPIVIKYTSSAFVDFQMLFCWMLSILVLEKNVTGKYKHSISGLLFGGMLASKLWVLVYLPAMTLFIYFIEKSRENFRKSFKKILVFLFFALIVPLLWYVRSFILTGNPIFPILSSPKILGESFSQASSIISRIESYVGLNMGMYEPRNIFVLGPFFLISALLFLFRFKTLSLRLFKNNFFILFLIIIIEQSIVKVSLGRHLLPIFLISLICFSPAINIYKKTIFKYCFSVLFIFIYVYYFLTTITTLPYGLGWADSDKYLTRILSLDNSSYYDFDGRFDNRIKENEKVATFGLAGFYYAKFFYTDVHSIFSEKKRDFTLLKEDGYKKLLINGGNLTWFCKKLSLINCPNEKISLIAYYPDENRKYNLYEIR